MARSAGQSRQGAPGRVVCTITPSVLPGGDRRTQTRGARHVLADVLGCNWSDKDAAWRLAEHSCLPDGGVQLVFEPGKGTGGLAVPPGADTWRAADWARSRATVELLRLFDEFWARRPDLSLKAAVARFREKYGHWAEWRGLRISASTLRLYRRRVDPASPHFDGNVDRRGRAPHRRRRKRRGSRRGGTER
jgi:hypothetical protein